MSNNSENHQSDSDEDCEVYFLKPVNEYNIVDKIKEANKELFSESTQNEKNDLNKEENPELAIRTSIETAEISTKISTIRKVTFAPNLEDYEPENSTQTEIEQYSSDEDDGINDINSLNGNKKIKENRFPTIDEEDQISEEMNSNDIINEHENMFEIKDTNENKNYSELNNDDDNDDVDEICEEIIETDGNNKIKEDSFSLHHKRAIMKQQTTFEYDEEDKKSLMNLLPASDAEEEDDDDERIKEVINNNPEYNRSNDSSKDDSIFIGIDDIEDDEIQSIDDSSYAVDDDQLSIIVASYLPDDFEQTLNITPMSPSKTKYCDNSSTNKTPYSYFRRSNGKIANSSKSSTSPLSNGRHFQLHRKVKSTNSIGSSAGCNTNNRNCNNLKLSYKTCCEFRDSIQVKLPKYTGYLSEYGLSRQQLEERDKKNEKKQRFVLEKTIKTTEYEMKKMQDNERAFTTWLRNKMRFPINKTRNMFDVKLRFAGRKKNTSSSNSPFGIVNSKSASET